MFAHIRKHQKWLMVLIIAIVVVSFVIFFTPNIDPMSLAQGESRQIAAYIDGEPVRVKEFQQAYRETALSFFLQSGRLFDQAYSDSRMDLAAERILLVDRAEEFGILSSSATVAKWTVEMFSMPGTNQVMSFQRDRYDGFMENVLPRHGMGEDDWDPFVQNQIAISQVYDMAALPGELVVPREAEREFVQNHRKAEVEAVFFSKDDFTNFALSMDGLGAFYTNRMAMYRKPDERSLHYIRLASTNYLAQAESRLSERTNLTEMIDAIWKEKGTNSFTENGIVLSEEDAKEKIRGEELETEGQQLAWEAANQFIRKLSEIDGLEAEQLPKLAEEEGYEAKKTPFFNRQQLIPDIAGDYSFTQAAYALTPEAPFTMPMRGRDGVYVVALDSIKESEVPPLEEIRAQVQQDYLDDNALTSSRTAAEDFLQELAAHMEEGLSFGEASGKIGREVVPLPPFSSRDARLPDGDPRADFQALKREAFAMRENEPSDAIHTRDGAMVLQVVRFTDPSQEDIDSGLPDTMKTLRQSRRATAIRAWIQKESAAIQLFSSQEEAN